MISNKIWAIQLKRELLVSTRNNSENYESVMYSRVYGTSEIYNHATSIMGYFLWTPIQSASRKITHRQQGLIEIVFKNG